MIDKARKHELLRRALGLRHKLKVLESMKPAETHEEIAQSTLTRWELEDELHAIEAILNETRHETTLEKKKMILEQLSTEEGLAESASKRKNKGV
jgi:HD-like signal output (HDOD) protein